MNQLQSNYDIGVIGGGIAGSMAAVAAARRGCRVIVLEEKGYPGGALTAMGTGPMMTFHAGDTQVIRGIPQEMISRLMERGFSPGHTADSTGYTYTVTPFSAEGMKCVLEEMMLEAGVTLLYHTVVHGADVSEGTLRRIRCFSCGQNFDIGARVFIDATGDGDLLELAGVPTVCGRPGDGKNQPMTMNFKIDGVNTEKIREVMAEHPEYFPFLNKKRGTEKKALRLSVSGFQDLMRQGIASGEVTVDRDVVLTFETNDPGEMIVNMSRINGEDPVNPFSLSRAETEGRRQAWELFRFLRARVPGYENARLLFTGPDAGIRSSRRMVGVYTLTAEDLLSERIFEDRIAACGYPIDIHSADGAGTSHRFLREGGWYTIPFRCLINSEVPNLMAAGRNISCTFEAQASTRVSPCCAAIGEAAGCAASLAVREGVPPARISVPALQRLLREEGAFLGDAQPE